MKIQKKKKIDGKSLESAGKMENTIKGDMMMGGSGSSMEMEIGGQDDGGRIGTRTVLWLLLYCGCIVMY